MENTPIEQPPGKRLGGVQHTVAKAGIALIPVIGGAAAELFALVLALPLEKRRDEWMAEVADYLSRMGETVESSRVARGHLGQNERA